MCEVNTRAVCEQWVLALAVALQEVFLVAWTAQEVCARVHRGRARGACLHRTLQKVLARVLVVQEVLACVVDG